MINPPVVPNCSSLRVPIVRASGRSHDDRTYALRTYRASHYPAPLFSHRSSRMLTLSDQCVKLGPCVISIRQQTGRAFGYCRRGLVWNDCKDTSPGRIGSSVVHDLRRFSAVRSDSGEPSRPSWYGRLPWTLWNRGRQRFWCVRLLGRTPCPQSLVIRRRGRHYKLRKVKRDRCSARMKSLCFVLLLY